MSQCKPSYTLVCLHSHLDNNFTRVCCCLGLYGANTHDELELQSVATFGRHHSLSVRTAERSIHRIATQACPVLVRLERAVAIIDLDLIRLHEEVACDIGACYLSAVTAMAEVPAGFSKQVLVGDCYGNASAEAGAGKRVGKLGGVMGVRVASRLVGHIEGGDRVRLMGVVQ